jgi:hypothetical protein
MCSTRVLRDNPILGLACMPGMFVRCQELPSHLRLPPKPIALLSSELESGNVVFWKKGSTVKVVAGPEPAQEDGCMHSNETAEQYLRERTILYGLPCAECRIYYPAGLTVCPVCHCRERVPARPTSLAP